MKIRRLLASVVFCALALPLAAQQAKTAAVAAPSGNCQISGIVVNAVNNLPLGQTHVTVTIEGGSFSRTVTTGEDGRFAFDHLRAGKYGLNAERRGFAAQGYQQHEERFSTGIVVGPELNDIDLVFRIAPDASFSGRVTDDRFEAVRNARVILIRETAFGGRLGKHVVGSTSTDDRGHYHFGHLPPGPYYIAVSARPWYAQPAFGAAMGSVAGRGFGGPLRTQENSALDVAYPLTFYPNVTDSSAATAITLRAGDRATADITLRAVPSLHVRIRNAATEGDRRGVQFPTATLVRVIFDGIQIPLQTTPSGSPGMNVISGVAPGHYLLRMLPQRLRRTETQIDDEEQPSRVREVDLVSDTELDASDIPSAAMVSGTVKLANGQVPPKPPTINLRPGGLRQIFGAAANAKGEFTFAQGFAVGSYQITMSNAEDLFIRSVTATGAKMSGRTLQIAGSESVTLTIVASEGASGKIEGVAQRDGKPVSGAMVLLVPQDPANNLPLFRRDQSDSDGTFTLPTVLPGRYTLLALENGWDMQWGDPNVLQPFLAGGEPVVVDAKGTYKLHVNVQ